MSLHKRLNELAVSSLISLHLLLHHYGLASHTLIFLVSKWNLIPFRIEWVCSFTAIALWQLYYLEVNPFSLNFSMFMNQQIPAPHKNHFPVLIGLAVNAVLSSHEPEEALAIRIIVTTPQNPQPLTYKVPLSNDAILAIFFLCSFSLSYYGWAYAWKTYRSLFSVWFIRVELLSKVVKFDKLLNFIA